MSKHWDLIRPALTGCPLRVLVLLASLALVGRPVVATPAADADCDKEEQRLLRRGTTNFIFENDLFTKSDRQYTNGLKLSVTTPPISDGQKTKCLFEWVPGLNNLLLKFTAKGSSVPVTMTLTMLAQEMYTPDQRDTKELIKNDRPYAGWLYGSYGVNARIDHGEKGPSELHSVEVQIGVVGPASGAKETQDIIHRAFDYKLFQGWANQLKNEPAFLVHYEYKYKPKSVFTISGEWGWSSISHAGVTFGTVASYLNAGTALRIGRNIPDDFGTSPIRPGGNNNAPLRTDVQADKAAPHTPRLGRNGLSAHLYLSLDARAVANNIFLNGNTWRESHSVPMRHFVTDAAFGGAIIGRCWKVAVGRVIRSKEFYLQPHSQKFGSILVAFEDGFFDNLFGAHNRCGT